MNLPNALIGQSGGPTSVINASLAGAVETAVGSGRIGKIYGMRWGIEGFMQEQLADLGAMPASKIRGLITTPSSALGSSRHKLLDEDLPVVLKLLKKYNIRYFFLTGGNDTMDTINRIEAYCRSNGHELAAVGIPKTVDNDLFGTDHTPGFPSAAMSNITNVYQSGLLARDMQKVDKFVVYQTIGRDAGWLAAATAMARRANGDAPHLIYAPEFAFNREKFLADVGNTIRLNGWAYIVCGEGLKYADGTSVSASQIRDRFSNTEYGAMGGASVAINLHSMITAEFGYRGEFQIPESLIMSDISRSVKLDRDEAYQCGAEAVRLALAGESGYMITINRIADEPYRAGYGRVPLNEVAIEARPMPAAYFSPEGNDVSSSFVSYMKPLTATLPEFVTL
jgi:ATP-dependent phosphofructokinase / diphosphate-dependent phosphofructokinase